MSFSKMDDQTWERGKKKCLFSTFPTPLHKKSINPPRFLFSYTHARISKEKIEGVCTGYSMKLYTAYWCYSMGSRRFESCWEFMTIFFVVPHSLHAHCRTFHIIVYSKYFSVSDCLHSPGSSAITNRCWPNLKMRAIHHQFDGIFD